MSAWLVAFLFTQALELPVYRYGARVGFAPAFIASCLTHPVVWFGFFSPALSFGHLERVVAAELFAWLAEAAYLGWLLRVRNAVGWSLAANATSLAVGLLSRYLFGIP